MRKSVFMPIILLLLAAGALVAPYAQAQTATTPYTAPVYYASAFNLWSILNQAPNSYSVQGGSICNSNAQNVPFFTFATNAPVLIADTGNPANSEVATPSAVLRTSGSCGITISPARTHFNFQMKSGTAGLQEALNNLSGSANYPAVIILDRNWYAAAWSVPSTTPQAIIAAAAGNAGIMLEDITTAPETFYSWNGSAYVSSGSASPVSFNQKVTSFTAISSPTALSTAASTNGLITTAATGGTIAAATYRLAATYVDASGGETLISTDSASTATIATSGSTSTISVTSPAAATGAVGWRLYMTAASGASGAEILYSPTCTGTQLQSVFPTGTVCAIGSTATISAIITGTATVPSLATAYPRTSGGNAAFPPYTALGTVSAAATGTLATVNFPAGYFNTLGRKVQVCGNGYATNNNTTGTVAVNGLIASVPGVTSITPWTVSYTTATTTAVQVPLNFCFTITTAATGSSGTLEVHGWLDARPATSGAGVAGVVVMDNIFAVSSAIDLTKQDQLQLTITPTTTGLTAAQVRDLTVLPLN